jgi:integrase/recombinase XerD
MNHAVHNEIGLTFQRFVDWAHEQGWRYQMVSGHLRHLQRFLERRGVQELGEINAALLADYQRSLSLHKSPATVNGYLNTLRTWWRYLLKEELVVEDACQRLSAVRLDYFVPHLYSEQDLLRIARATRVAIGQAHDPRQRFSRRTQHAAFGLLRDCGLRVSEACRLDVQHYDPSRRTLRIERTKFFKTRLIPLPRSTCTVLGEYLKYRNQLVAHKSESPAFFVSKNGRRLTRETLETHFKHLLCELGLYQPRRCQGRTVFGSANLHALRHSYAVRTLERWQLEGRDVEHLLPLLSGYLGHVNVSYTKHYLHLTPTLRQLASERFAELVLPRLDRHRTLDDDE